MLEELLVNLRELTADQASGVMVWHVKNIGYLGCLINRNAQQIPGTTTWDYQPTVEAVITDLTETATRLGQRVRK